MMTGTFTIISGNLPPKPPYKHWYFSLKSCFLQTSPVLEGIGRQNLDSFSTKKKKKLHLDLQTSMQKNLGHFSSSAFFFRAVL